MAADASPAEVKSVEPKQVESSPRQSSKPRPLVRFMHVLDRIGIFRGVRQQEKSGQPEAALQSIAGGREAKAEKGPEQPWIRIKTIVISEGDPDNHVSKEELKVLDTPSESLVIPITTDGEIVLSRRKAPAEGGKPIITALSAANPDKDPTHAPNFEAMARRALTGKLDIPESENVTLTEVGKFHSWKYLTSQANCFGAKLEMSSEAAARLAPIESSIAGGAPTEGPVVLSEAQFYQMVDSGAISDLPTIVAAEFVLAARRQEREGRPQVDFKPNPEIVSRLNEPLVTAGSKFTEDPVGRDWFPTKTVDGEQVVGSKGDLSQAIAVVEQDGIESFVLVMEPSYAQGKWLLHLPGGSQDGVSHSERAVKELQEETGFLGEANGVEQPRRQPLQLYLESGSVACEVQVTGKGEQTGGDEKPFEPTVAVTIPVDQVGEYIRRGLITDAATIVAFLQWGRAHNVRML